MNSRYKTTKAIEINPDVLQWNFMILSLFINERKSYKYDPKNGARIQINRNGENYYFLKFINESNQKD